MRIIVAYRAIDGIAGGVEKMSISLMNEMARRGHDVDFITLDSADASAFYPMDERVKWHKIAIGDWRKKASWPERFQRFQKTRSIIKSIQPDVIIGFQDGAFFHMRTSSAGLNIPVILAERIAPSHFDFTGRGRYRSFFYRLYSLASKITVQCESYVSQYPAFLRRKINVIPNPVLPSTDHAHPATPDNNGFKTLLCVGRIGYQKNQEALIHAFASIHHEFPEWRLVLAGGDQITQAQSLAQKLEIAHKIHLPGAVKDVSALYRTSHLFCLPSRWEGFPNALAEAMAHGLPAIGFEECGGVRDLIQHEHTGLLADGNGNAQTLATCLQKLMSDDNARKDMGAAAIQEVQKYDPAGIFDLWEDLFKKAAGKT